MSDLAPLLEASIREQSRRDCVIGASQISSVLGIDRFTTPQQLYARMTGAEPWPEEGPDMRRGKFLEPGLCAWWCHEAKAERREAQYARHGTVLGNGQLQVRHPEHAWCRATPDIVAECQPWGSLARALIAVDVKSPRSDGKKVGEAWVKTWSTADQVAPRSYVAQSVYQQGVLRAAGVPVVAGELAAGPVWGALITVAVPFDAEFFALMLERAAEFRLCVLERRPLPSTFQQQED